MQPRVHQRVVRISASGYCFIHRKLLSRGCQAKLTAALLLPSGCSSNQDSPGVVEFHGLETLLLARIPSAPHPRSHCDAYVTAAHERWVHVQM
eukprot:412151-Pelagomonas_calceolata.AAC.5